MQPLFLHKAKAPGLTLGSFVVEALDTALEPYRAAGYDFVCIDCQHSLIDERMAGELLYRTNQNELAIVVRVAENNLASIGRVLDAGAHGIIVPGIDTADDARHAVAATQFAPLGARSYGPLRADLGTDPQSIANNAVCLVMVETALALQNLEQICATPGLSGIFIGPADLSVALGLEVSGAFTSDQLAPYITRIVAAANSAGLVVGAHAVDAASAKRWKELGCDFVTMSSNRRLLARSIAAAAREVRGIHGEAVTTLTPGEAIY